MTLPTIPHDKAMHVLYGVVIALAALYAMRLIFGIDERAAKLIALAAAVAAGVLKEGADYAMNRKAGPDVHTVDGMDALATAVGGAIVWLA